MRHRIASTQGIAATGNAVTIRGMAKKRKTDRHKRRTYSMRLEDRLMQQVKELAERNRRTATMEVTIALEEHLQKAGLWPPPSGPQPAVEK